MTVTAPPSTPSRPKSPEPDKKSKHWWWALLLVLVPMGMLSIPVLMIVAISGSSVGGPCAPSPQLGLAPGGGTPVAGLNPKQTQIAATIIGHVAAKKLPTKAAVIAVATAWDESTLRNLANPAVPESLSLPNDGVGYDHGSVGIMQQQPWWGSAQQLMNPGIATDKFLDALVKQVPGWESMDPAQAITTVQDNRDGASVYQPFVAQAAQVVAKLQNSPQAQALIGQSGGGGGPGCTPGGMAGGIPGFVPGGPPGPNAVAAAASQMGIRYSWGGGDLNGPTPGMHDGGNGDAHGDYMTPGWDCSALARYAIYKATGKVIQRSSEDQSAGGQPVPDMADAQPGDLVFFGGVGSAHHVGIYMGGGKMIDAPYSGTKVRIDQVLSDGPPTFRRYT